MNDIYKKAQQAGKNFAKKQALQLILAKFKIPIAIGALILLAIMMGVVYTITYNFVMFKSDLSTDYENVYYQIYTNKSFYFTVDEPMNTNGTISDEDSEHSGKTLEELLEIHYGDDADTILNDYIGKDKINQADVDTPFQDVDNYEKSLTLDLNALKTADKFLNGANASYNANTNPAQLIRPVYVVCKNEEGEYYTIANETGDFDVKECRLGKLSMSPNKSFVSNEETGYYEMAADGMSSIDYTGVPTEELNEEITTWGLGSILHYQPYYQPYHIDNYHIETLQVVNEDNYSHLTSENATKTLTQFQVREAIVDKYNRNNLFASERKEGYVEGSNVGQNWNTGYFIPNQTIEYKDLYTGETYSSVFKNNSTGYKEIWAKSAFGNSSGIPLTNVSFVIDYAVTPFGAYSFDINKEWVKISDTTETIQTTYFKEYQSIIYDDEVKYIGGNAKGYKAVYVNENGLWNLIGYIAGDDSPIWHPAKFKTVSERMDKCAEWKDLCNYECKVPSSMLGGPSTTKTYSGVSCGSHSDCDVKDSWSVCDRYNPMEDCGDTSCKIREDANFNIVNYNGEELIFDDSHRIENARWEFHIILDENAQLCDKNVEVEFTEDINRYEEAPVISEHKRNYLGFFYKPAYAFTLNATFKGDLQMYTVSHASGFASLEENDEEWDIETSGDTFEYMKDYYRNYTSYVFANDNQNYACVPIDVYDAGGDFSAYGGHVSYTECENEEVGILLEPAISSIGGEVDYSKMTDAQKTRIEETFGFWEHETTANGAGWSMNFGGDKDMSDETLKVGDSGDETDRSLYYNEVDEYSRSFGVSKELLIATVNAYPDFSSLSGTYEGIDLGKIAIGNQDVSVEYDGTAKTGVQIYAMIWQKYLKDYSYNVPIAAFMVDATLSGENAENLFWSMNNEYQTMMGMGILDTINETYNITWIHLMGRLEDEGHNVTASSGEYFSNNILRFLTASNVTNIDVDKLISHSWDSTLIKDELNISDSDLNMKRANYIWKNMSQEERIKIWDLLTFGQEDITYGSYFYDGHFYKNGYYLNQVKDELDNLQFVKTTKLLSDDETELNQAIAQTISKMTEVEDLETLTQWVAGDSTDFLVNGFGDLKAGLSFDNYFGSSQSIRKPIENFEREYTREQDNAWIFSGVENGQEVLSPIDGEVIFVNDESIVIYNSDTGGQKYTLAEVRISNLKPSILAGDTVSSGDVIGETNKETLYVYYEYGSDRISYTGNLRALKDLYVVKLQNSASWYGTWSGILNMVNGQIYMGAEANAIWEFVNSVPGNTGYPYNCTAFVDYCLYEAYGDSYPRVGGNGMNKAKYLVEKAGWTYADINDPSSITAGSVFSLDYGNGIGHTGWITETYEEDGEWYVSVMEGNITPGSGGYGTSGSGIRYATYSYNDWVGSKASSGMGVTIACN